MNGAIFCFDFLEECFGERSRGNLPLDNSESGRFHRKQIEIEAGQRGTNTFDFLAKNFTLRSVRSIGAFSPIEALRKLTLPLIKGCRIVPERGVPSVLYHLNLSVGHSRL